ncbi:MAG: hypothetical protein AB202_00200 [Parcubacteria bacterium C7867-007]|nr:MAG: hypothetical protein AB202_00200 [Parcubacteria bacterium C7867-007]
MSERKSWDVVRKPVKPVGHPVATHAPAVSSGPRRNTPTKRTSSRPLKEQRKKQRKTVLIIVSIILVILVAAAMYVAWLPALRVSAFEVKGSEQEGIRATAERAITGIHWFGLPRNSIFVLPETAIRDQILADYPSVSAVSLKPTALNTILITVTPRVSGFIWCGVSVDAPPADGQCFDTDSEGLVFGPATYTQTSASSSLRIFAPLDREIGVSPVGAHVVNSKQIPDALRFVKAVRSLGAPVSTLSIQGDEADLYLQGPTRIRYVLGREEQAAQLATSVFPTLTLTDRTIEYIDLRFVGEPGQPGKVYVKRFGE